MANIRSIRNSAPLTSVVGASRDDLLPGDTITLESVDVAITYTWTLAYTPEDSDLVPSSATLANEDQQTTSFSVDHTGPYLVRLILDLGLETESVQFVRLRALTDFGNLRLISAGERKDSFAVVPVDADVVGWADDQNYNLKRLGESVARAAASGRVLYVDSNRGTNYGNPPDDANIARGFGDYSTINAATAAAQADPVPPSSDNPYTIIVRPGLYVEDLALAPYVYVIAETHVPSIVEPVHLTGRGVIVRAENVGGTGTHTAITANPNQICSAVGITVENVANSTTQAALEISGPGGVYLQSCYVIQRASAPSVGPALHVDGSSVWTDGTQILNYASPALSPLLPAVIVDGENSDVMICRGYVFGPVCADVNPNAVADVVFRVEFSRLKSISTDLAAYGVRSVATETVFKFSSIETTDPPERHLLVNPDQLAKPGICVVRIAHSAVREVIFDTTNLVSPRLILESPRVGSITVLPSEASLVPGYVEADTDAFGVYYDNTKLSGNPIGSKNVQDALDEIALGGVTNVTTTDATATIIQTLLTTPGSAYRVNARVTGISASDDASFELSALVRNSGAPAFGSAGVVNEFTDANGTAWGVTFALVGSEIRVLVTGAAATTVNWVCRFTHEQVSI